VPSSVVYSASKSAVNSITKARAKELGDRKIRVNAIAPGMTVTEGVKDLGITLDMAKAIGAPIPLKAARGDDIARVALFLASDQSSWLTDDASQRLAVSGSGNKYKPLLRKQERRVWDAYIRAISQSADGRISAVEVVIEAASWALVPAIASRHGHRRSHRAKERPNDRNAAAIPAVVVRISNLANGGGVSLLASGDRVIAIWGAERLRKNWRRKKTQRHCGRKKR
jgi:hypothetical protein